MSFWSYTYVYKIHGLQDMWEENSVHAALPPPQPPLPHVFRPGQACSFVNLLSSTHFFVQGQTCAFVTSPFPFLVQSQSCQCVHLLSFMYFWSRMWILTSPQITPFFFDPYLCFFWSGLEWGTTPTLPRNGFPFCCFWSLIDVFFDLL